jgi:hypothetical protein
MKKIYFLISTLPNINDYGMIQLAEGLKKMGVFFCANRDYWKTDVNEDYLFKYNKDFNPSTDADVVILSNSWTENVDPISFQPASLPLPEWLFNNSKRFLLIYLDLRDGYKTISYTSLFHKFDFIFRAQKNSRTKNWPNIYPWAFGFQNRVIREKKNISLENKKFQVAVNFYYSHKYVHQLRELAEKKIISKFDPLFINREVTAREKPKEAFGELMFNQSAGLHNPKYYSIIENTLIVAAFCGYMVPGLPDDPSVYLVGGNKAKLKKKFYQILSTSTGSEERIIQWDSYRFWETLALGSVPMHIDLEKYGVELPVMPLNWKHYMGVDLNNIGQTVERIIEEKELIYKIAKDGNEWCMTNYSPEASAKRFLKTIGLSSEIQKTLIIQDRINNPSAQ